MPSILRRLSFLFCFLLIPFVVLSFFDFPSADDFTYANVALAKGFWGAQSQWYNAWSGRYTSTGLLSLSPMVFKFKFGYTLGALVVFAAFLGSNYLLFSRVVGNTLKPAVKACIFCVFVFIFLAEMPSPVEGFYWYTGAIHYTWAWILFALGASWYISNRGWSFDSVRAPQSGVLMSIGLAFLSFFIVGMNETMILLEVYLIGAAALFYFLAHRKMDWSLVFPLLVCLVGFYFVLKAPGNDARAAHFTQNKNLVRAIVKATGLSIEVFIRYLKPAFILGLILSIPFALEIKQKIPAPFYAQTNRRLFILGLIGVLVVFLLPAQWAMDGAPPKRAMNTLCLLHMIFVSIVFFQTLWAYEERGRKFYAWLLAKLPISVWRLAFVISLLVWGNHLMVWTDLLTKVGSYREQQTERLQILESSAGKAVVFKKIWPQPESLMFDDITEDPSDWRNEAMQSYYGLQSIQLKKSAGN